VLVGQFLNVILRAPVIVLRDELFLEHFLQFIVDFAAHTTHRHARILRLGLDHLDDVAAPLFRQAGMWMRMICPAVFGVSPKSDL